MKAIAARDKKAYLQITNNGDILDVYTPIGYGGMATPAAAINRNISEFLGKRALTTILHLFKIVLKTKRSINHGFIMRYENRVTNRIMTIFPGQEKNTVECLLISLRQNRLKRGAS